MTRRAIDLTPGDLTVLAAAMGRDPESLDRALRERPWTINDVLRHPDVVGLATGEASRCETATCGASHDRITQLSPTLFFVILAFQAADGLAEADWVSDWIEPNERLPVFDIEPLHEFIGNERRLTFVARLLAGFAAPAPPPVPASGFDLVEMVDWIDAVDDDTRRVLLRRMGDLALFTAGVFPDAVGASGLSADDAVRLARSAGIDGTRLWELIDPSNPTPGLAALETLGAAWYLAAAEGGRPTGSRILTDIAHRMRPARRFVNHLADRYLNPRQLGWGLAT